MASAISARGEDDVDRREAVCDQLAGTAVLQLRVLPDVGDHKQVDITARRARLG